MEIGKILLEALSHAREHHLHDINTNIKRIDFATAQALKNRKGFKIVEQLEVNLRKVESMYKSYALGVISNDKDMRIESMKSIKTLGEDLSEYLKGFKKQWNEHLKSCLENQECDTHNS